MSDSHESQYTNESHEIDEDSVALRADLDVVMSSLLGSIAPSQELLERLQTAVAQPPLRYAPFFARVAELFDISEAAAIAELTKLADPKAWRFAGLPGVRNMVVRGGPRVEGAETVFARIAPGTRFPGHRHGGVEKVFVLEGEYEDSAGIVHRTGEFREWSAGTKHAFRVSDSEPCIFASVVFGREFEAWPLRFLARALGR